MKIISSILLLSAMTSLASDGEFDNVTIYQDIHSSGNTWSIGNGGYGQFTYIYSPDIFGGNIMGNNLSIDGDGGITGTLYCTTGNFLYLLGNGPGITHIAAHHIDHQLIQSNFVSGKLYTNTYNSVIKVAATVELSTTNQIGSAVLELRSMASPSNGGWTNKASVITSSSTIPTTLSQYVAIEVQTNAIYCFTNMSTGGNSSSVIGGQISY